MAAGTAGHEAERHRLAALIVTYFPDSSLPDRIDTLLRQIGRVVLVDNGSDDRSLLPLGRYDGRQDVSILRNPGNLGIAKALNQGLAFLAAEGFGWVVTLDQDSSIRPGFAAALLETLEAQPDPSQVALIGANRINPDSNDAHRWLRPRSSFPFFERVTCEKAAQGATLVITSGTLTNTAAFNQLGGFRDELFIDLVDFEYCLRARQHGYMIVVSCRAELSHKVGNQAQLRVMGMSLSSTHHSQLRRYYLFRNSIYLIKRYGVVFPHWLLYHLLAMSEVILGIMISETDKFRKLHACAAGILDGLAGTTGPCRRNWGGR